jgi:hypothetical protein
LSRNDVERITQRSLGDLRVLDPFAGGGNLLFEPARLGMNCTQ